MSSIHHDVAAHQELLEEATTPAQQPRGMLTHLKTVRELRTALATIEVYTLPLAAPYVNNVVSSLRSLVSTDSLQHLRRVVRPSTLPASVLSELPSTPPKHSNPPILQLLLCAVDAIPLPTLLSNLSTQPPFSADPSVPPTLTILRVPRYQPTSSAQAAEWSSRFWPAVYKGGNPFGPHPPVIRSTQTALQNVAGGHITLARAVGRESAKAGLGIAAGAVVVDPRSGAVVAVAGDARKKAGGSPLDHAVMRAVAMVAQARLPEGVEVAPDNPVRPLTVLEKQYFARHTSVDKNEEEEGKGKERNPVLGEKRDREPAAAAKEEQVETSDGGEGGGAYLCHNLQVYLSHEPCVMCAMALLHSRVGTVVFARRMPKTGALTADEGGLGHGLFWRPELNWKYLCWQWQDADGAENRDEPGDDGVAEEVSV